MFLVIGGLAFLSHYYTLDGIKSKTVGDGQHGTARWATKQEIRQTYAHVPFEPELWRKGEHLPEKQGLVLGCEGPKDHVTALVDTDDIHAMVTAASGAGKTAFFLYPNIEYALASGMSFLCTDTKGDLFRNYAGIAKDCYGYQIAVLDLRNPTRSDGNNLLHLINKYMDIYKADPKNLAAKAKAEKYSKILAKTLINTSGGDSAQYGQNAFFYDSAWALSFTWVGNPAPPAPTTPACSTRPSRFSCIMAQTSVYLTSIPPTSTHLRRRAKDLAEVRPSPVGPAMVNVV